jgi:hypothetical protein
VHYERSFLRDVRSQLDDIIRDAERFETDKLDRTLRSALIFLGIWELLALALTMVLAGGALTGNPDVTTLLMVFGIGIGLIIFGLVTVPLRGWLMSQTYERRLREDRDNYLAILRRATTESVAHGVQLRQDATAPFTRLISTQSELLEKLRADLENQRQALVRIQSGLAQLNAK